MRLRRWRVRVASQDYGRYGTVFVTRSVTDFYQHGVQVATIRLDAEDAEHQLAEARAAAQSYCRQLRDLERLRP